MFTLPTCTALLKVVVAVEKVQPPVMDSASPIPAKSVVGRFKLLIVPALVMLPLLRLRPPVIEAPPPLTVSSFSKVEVAKVEVPLTSKLPVRRSLVPASKVRMPLVKESEVSERRNEAESIESSVSAFDPPAVSQVKSPLVLYLRNSPLAAPLLGQV